MKERVPLLLVFAIVLAVTVCDGALWARDKDRTLRNSDNPTASDRAGDSLNMVAPIRLLAREGGRVDWNNRDVIAFDRLDGPRGKRRYEVFAMKPDGTELRCITCDRNAQSLPHGWIGQPAWHPANRLLVVQAEKEHHPKVIIKAAVSPGAGAYNDLWLVRADGGRATLLHEIPNKKNHAVLHPHFSPDGTKLSWSEMTQGVSFAPIGRLFGYWKLKIADFVVEGDSARLTNIRELEPSGLGWYENHGFSPDGKQLIYTHNTECGDPRSTSNIYTMDVETGKSLRQLTDSGYNEHGSFSPDGRRIAWMSSTGNGKNFDAGTDFWLMNADGSGKRRLTFFNQKRHPQSLGKKAIASDSSWSPDGKSLAAYVQVVTIPYQERIYIVDVPE